MFLLKVFESSDFGNVSLAKNYKYEDGADSDYLEVALSFTFLKSVKISIFVVFEPRTQKACLMSQKWKTQHESQLFAKKV